ncbi:ABC transporter ATP-binding protein [Brevibacterium sp. HMSC08F02]|uniref:ABC transporter ATP-binding protein n=1 Tax=Brevibacterium sp. HMSC08F02 TaxID=1581140 RepID=UPI0008A2AE29|nr:ATP-binding cassette domain-containing protein [Brevibacterium sp. HMSC08F02]OFT26500.1 ABC transporter ATP-binding protein [Brevibacterium sp. HMSC08F02]
MTTTSSSRPAAVSARGFTWYHSGRAEPAVSDLDLEIPAGQKVLLVGGSGAGKSTFLHAVAGVLPDESGEQFGELLVDGLPPDPARGISGLVLQDPDSQVILAEVGDDVAFGMANVGIPAADIARRIPEALDIVGLDVPLTHPTAALSGGQKQRLAIAGVVVMQPGLLVLDEPTANLDPAAVESVRDSIIAAQEATGATMLIVEHRLPVWTEHVDRIVVLGPGGVLADGSPDTILADQTLRPSLEAAGLWLPDAALPTPYVPTIGETLMTADGLGVQRENSEPVAELTAAIHAGTALALTGRNGVGKSTTALTLAGLLKPAYGQLTAADQLTTLNGTVRQPKHSDPFRWSSRELVPRIGMVFQEPEHQFLRPTVLDELRFGPQRAGWDPQAADDRAEQLLAALRLEHLADIHPQQLSGGEKRRLSVAAMLAARPRILIIDEPTFGQDARTWRALAELVIDELRAGQAVVTVSHDEPFIDTLGAVRCEFA